MTARAFKCAAAVLGIASALSGQTKVRISITDSRPLCAALDALERIVDRPINYEDPPYQNPGDLQNSPTLANQPGPPLVIWVPKIGTVAGDIPAPTSTPAPGTEIAGDIGILLASYRQNGLPGGFAVEQANAMTYVVPATVLAADGARRPVTSVMDVPVRVPFQNRTVAGTVAALFEALRTATGLRTGIGSIPFLPIDKVNFGSDGEPIRDALARLFAQVGGGPYSYRLLFDPLPNGRRRPFDYIINIHHAGYARSSAPPGTAAGPSHPATAPAGPGPGFTKSPQ